MPMLLSPLDLERDGLIIMGWLKQPVSKVEEMTEENNRRQLQSKRLCESQGSKVCTLTPRYFILIILLVKSGVHALQEIRRMQKCMEFLIPKLPFQRLIKKISKNFIKAIQLPYLK